MFLLKPVIHNQKSLESQVRNLKKIDFREERKEMEECLAEYLTGLHVKMHGTSKSVSGAGIKQG